MFVCRVSIQLNIAPLRLLPIQLRAFLREELISIRKRNFSFVVIAPTIAKIKKSVSAGN